MTSLGFLACWLHVGAGYACVFHSLDHFLRLERIWGWLQQMPHAEADFFLWDRCNRTAVRRRLSDALAVDMEVGSVRISANGWEGRIIEGMKVSAVLPCVSHLLAIHGMQGQTWHSLTPQLTVYFWVFCRCR